MAGERLSVRVFELANHRHGELREFQGAEEGQDVEVDCWR